MRLRIPSALVGAACLAVGMVAVNIRQEFLNVPRIRVGPLSTVLPEKPTLRLFALGDTGTGGEFQHAVAAAMEAECQAVGGIDGILLLGDNAYPSGFASVEDPQWQTKVMGPYGSPCLDHAPIYPVLGNHDYKNNPAAEIEYSLINQRWRMPNRFYSVTFGKLLKLIAFDSNISEFCFKPAFCAVDFLLHSIETADTAWTFVTAHHPVASSSAKGFGYRGGFRRWLLAPLLCHKIDAWLAGHAHHLEHRVPPECRMELYIAGGGGGDLDETGPPDTDTRFLKETYGFLALDINAQELKSKFIGADGRVLYQATKARALPEGR